LNRENGQPINPIIEAAVLTFTDVPGDEVWPTQPTPLTSSGHVMAGVVPTFPLFIPSELQSRAAPFYTVPRVNEFIIFAPGAAGGVNFGSLAYSPRTGLLYAAGIDSPTQGKVQPLGNTLMPGQFSFVFAATAPTGRTARGYVSAFDPVTNELIWQVELPGACQAGVVATQGDLVYVGDGLGFFYAFDARTGEILYKFQTGAGIASAPIVYMLNDVEYVAVASGGRAIGGRRGDLVVAFALPER